MNQLSLVYGELKAQITFTFATLYSSNVTLNTTVMEFVYNPMPTVAYKYFRFYAVSSSASTGNPGLSWWQLLYIITL